MHGTQAMNSNHVGDHYQDQFAGPNFRKPTVDPIHPMNPVPMMIQIHTIMPDITAVHRHASELCSAIHT